MSNKDYIETIKNGWSEMLQTAIVSETYHIWPTSHQYVCGPTLSCNSTEVIQISWSSEENNLDLKFIFWIIYSLENVITE